jgi:hypothetical protein
VLHIPSYVEDKEDLKIIEADWRKYFHLYPLQSGSGKKTSNERDSDPGGTYEMVPVKENE